MAVFRPVIYLPKLLEIICETTHFFVVVVGLWSQSADKLTVQFIQYHVAGNTYYATTHNYCIWEGQVVFD